MIGYWTSERGAGPRTTLPERSYWDPWQGQLMRPPDGMFTLQPACVQDMESAISVPPGSRTTMIVSRRGPMNGVIRALPSCVRSRTSTLPTLGLDIGRPVESMGPHPDAANGLRNAP